jgi:hypothetical protein
MMVLFVTIDRHNCPAAKRRPRGFVPLPHVRWQWYEAGIQEIPMARPIIFTIIVTMAMLSIVGTLVTSARMLGWF